MDSAKKKRNFPVVYPFSARSMKLKPWVSALSCKIMQLNVTFLSLKLNPMMSQRLFNQVLSIASSLFFVEVATPNLNSSLFLFFFL